MKKLLAIATMSLLVASAFGQGVVVFGNRDSANGIAAIVTDDGGAAVTGTAGWAALLGGPTTATGYTVTKNGGFTAGTLAQLGAAVNFRAAPAGGYIVQDTRTITGVAPGAQAKLQFVAWTGNSADWSTALTAATSDGTIHVGASAPWTVTASDPTSPVLPVNTGLSAFSVVPIVATPEPTTMALAGLGAAALLIFRRRK